MKTISRISPARSRQVRNLTFVVPLVAAAHLFAAPDLPIVKDVEAQPFTAQIRRLIEAMEYSGAPLAPKEHKALAAALARADPEAIQQILDPHCLFAININPASRVKVARGPAPAELVEQGWRQFLVKVE